MSGFETIAMIAGGLGTAIDVAGTLQRGREDKARFAYEAKVDKQQADEAQAASQRDAAQRYREGRLLESQQRAAIAGSGGDLNDPSVIDLMNDTKDQVTYAADSDIYKGEQQKRGYNDAAKVAGINGKNAMKGAWISAGANLFGGISTMYTRFGKPAKNGGEASEATAPLYYPYSSSTKPR